MVDISEIVGDSPLRASLMKKRQKVQEKLDAIALKAHPLVAEIECFDKMLRALDEKDGIIAQEV